MNKLLAFYFALPHDRTLGILTKAFNRLVARILKRILDRTVPAYFLRTQHLYPNGLNKAPRNKKVVVSLTSFPARIEDVWIVIECLFRQTYKADRIILWLSKPQFQGVEIPASLLAQKERGLEIVFVDDDLKSHKKYLYALDRFPNDYIVTVDDDLYYDKNLLSNLVRLKNKYPECVATNRAHELSFNKNGSVAPYHKWSHNTISSKPSFTIVQTGGFGTLYTRQDVDESYNDLETIKEHIPHADDLWLKVQTLLASKKVVTNERYNKDPLTIKKSQLEKLVNMNVHDGGNNQQLGVVLDHFKLGNLEEFRQQNSNFEKS